MFFQCRLRQKKENTYAFRGAHKPTPHHQPSRPSRVAVPTMRVAEVDTVKVSRIQRCFRVKRAIRKLKCLKYVDLHKRLNSFFVKLNTKTTHNIPLDINAYNQLDKDTIVDYNALRLAITPIREELLHILLGKMYDKTGLTQFCRQMSNLIVEEESIALRSRLVSIRASHRYTDAPLHGRRMDHFRTGCEEEKLVMLGAQVTGS